MSALGPVRTPRDRVVDRLAVVRALLEQKRPIAEPKQVGFLRDGTVSSPWDQHDSLCNYLLLTCFDVLGQAAPFVDFQKWLESGKLKEEREQAAASLPPGLDQVETALQMWKLYNDRYSVTKGFYRFIDEVLTEDARKALLDSVAIARHPQVDDEKKTKLKKRFLYRFRNDFTHGAIAPMTVDRSEDGSRKELLIVGEKSKKYGPTYRFVGGDIEDEGIAWVSDWPYVLYRTVAGAVGEPVPVFETTHTLQLFFEDGAFLTVPNVAGKDFQDPAKRLELINDLERRLEEFRRSKREGGE